MRDTTRVETTDLTTPVSSIEAAGAIPQLPETLTYSPAEAAAVIRVSRPAIYRMIARRYLIPLPGMRHKRIPKKQVDRLARHLG